MRRRFTSNMDNSKETPLYIEALEDDVKFSAMYKSGSLQYRVNDGEYFTISSDTFTETINKGSRFYIKGDYCFLDLSHPRFTINGKCKIGGNVHSVSFGDSYSTITSSGYCQGMFSNCDIVEVEIDFLKYTTLTDGCYTSMFQGCTSLQIAPELPATTLATNCYHGMFQGCTSLQVAPELPATTLVNFCYSYMFDGCTSLVNAPELPATTLATSCYSYMFDGCTSLVNAPELPATTLENNCYGFMFSGCTKLNYIKMLATDISATSCLYTWVSRVASSGTFVKNAAMHDLPTGASGIPKGWTVQNV